MVSYELLFFITQANLDISHFLLRLYKNSPNPFVSAQGDFSYHFIGVEKLQFLEQEIISFENQGFMVALTSMVMTTRGMRSLLLLDFAIPQSPRAMQELIEKIATFNKSGDISYKLDGWLIKTNVSYHYLGKYMTSQENFRHFLGSSLLFRHKDQHHFVVDDRWLGHQLKRGYGSIRIGHKEHKNYPTVIVEIK